MVFLSARRLALLASLVHQCRPVHAQVVPTTYAQPPTPPPAVAYPPAVTTPPPMSIEDKGEVAGEIVGGMIVGLLNQSSLPAQQMQCIKGASLVISENIVKASAQLISVVQAVFGKGSRRLLPAGETGGGTPSIMPDVKGKLVGVFQLAKQEAAKCITPDDVLKLEIAMLHMTNLTYMGGMLLANGADIAYQVTYAIRSWERRDFNAFGLCLGKCAHEIVLGRRPKGQGGAPDAQALELMSGGILKGFFGSGFRLTLGIKDDQTGLIKQEPIDLHRCVAKNILFFRAVFGGVSGFFEEMKNQAQGVPDDTEAARQQQAQVQMSLATAMMGFPQAMVRCSPPNADVIAIADAIDALTHGREKLELPTSSAMPIDDALDMAQCVKDWQEHNWEDFGVHLGHMLQHFTLIAFPSKYSLDSMGRLQLAKVSSLLSALVAGVAFSAAIVLVVARKVWSSRSALASKHQWAPVDNVENGCSTECSHSRLMTEVVE